MSSLKYHFNRILFPMCFAMPFLGPWLRKRIQHRMQSLVKEIKTDICQKRANFNLIDELPQQGLSAQEILQRFQHIEAAYVPGRSSSTVYTEYDANLSHLLQQVWAKTNLTNPLRFEWPLIHLLEAEVIAMCQQLLHGDKDAPGMITHGGSLAILEACKAYVIQARKRGLINPVIVAPSTVHVAFDKAAQILNVRLIKIAVNTKTGTIHIKDLKNVIKEHKKTICLIVASLPCFPFGTIDPIDEMAKLAAYYRLPLHVDACLGGFLVMFAQDAGVALPNYDFALPGVDSMTIGTHKYGQTPNGSSLVLFRKESKVSPIQVHLDWLGGLYVSPGIDGTRSGADIALAWSVLCAKGRDEYIRETQLILSLKEKLWRALCELADVVVPYYPQLSIIVICLKVPAWTLLVTEYMREKNGWQLNPLQDKRHQVFGFHFCLTAIHAYQNNFCEQFIDDLSAAISHAKINPRAKLNGIAQVYPALASGSISAALQEQMGRAYIHALNSVTDET